MATLRLMQDHDIPRPVGVEPVAGGRVLDRTSTGTDLVQWIDPAGHVWTANPTSDLMHRDLHEVTSIRTGVQYPNRRNRHGWYAWTGARRHIWFESSLEMDSLVALDQRGDVTGIAAQPLRILFRGGSPCLSHVPDYFAVLADGTQVLYDVKPMTRMTPAVAEQFAETARVCAAVGWRHGVIHESTTTRRENLSLLREFRHPRCHPKRATEARILDVFSGGRTLEIGRRMLNLQYPELAMPDIAHLLWHRFLDFAWETPLALDVVLTTTQRGTPCCDHI
jgi:hypothetical protein